ncbi:hypothetical protein NDU88_005017 [Pleurodeles waltl]|uniref:Uncharacterized protein n=1 Tax=Pleurodeles waltl TaxID=8319 RepID=A0AAV7NLB3_PLEWA|nr:hypothetical protein NDU88_005016 [Pleurodeles waltl]KAJ1116812.1 hypothetical protein NDU88_005017 [Pleurodeles waltl]
MSPWCHTANKSAWERSVTLVPYSKQKRVGAQRNLGATRQAEAHGSEISPECRTQQAKVCRSAASSCTLNKFRTCCHDGDPLRCARMLLKLF